MKTKHLSFKNVLKYNETHLASSFHTQKERQLEVMTVPTALNLGREYKRRSLRDNLQNSLFSCMTGTLRLPFNQGKKGSFHSKISENGEKKFRCHLGIQ